MGKPLTPEQYGLNLDLSAWEIDFLGRIRSLKEEALEEYLATDQVRRSSQVLLGSEVWITFLALAADQEKLQLASSTLDVQEALYQLIEKRHLLGLGSQLDLSRAKTQVEAARGDVAKFTQLVAQDSNALELLVGRSFSQDLLPKALAELSPPRQISPGLCSQVLFGRPDILARGHRLKAANVDIGAARAAFFPRISVTGALGTASFELTELFKAGSGDWSYIPRVVMPIFEARLWSAWEATKVERQMALVEYQKAIQKAFQEVADAMVEQESLGRTA